MTVTLLCALALHIGSPTADTSIRLARGSAVEISSFMGAITVRTGSDDMLTLRGGQLSRGGGTVHIEGDDASRPSRGTLEVTLPAWATLDVDSYNGSITFEGTPARLHAETVNGSITVRSGTGTASLESVNGSITVSEFHGDRLSIDATAGDVTVTGATGSVSAESINGSVRLSDMRATALQASSINEVVEYSGTLDPRGTYELESHNGGINLWLPADVSARMKISTFNGAFASPDIPATTTGVRPEARPRSGKRSNANRNDNIDDQEFTVTFGKGDASVSLDSFNGNITVHRLRPR